MFLVKEMIRQNMHREIHWKMKTIITNDASKVVLAAQMTQIAKEHILTANFQDQRNRKILICIVLSEKNFGTSMRMMDQL